MSGNYMMHSFEDRDPLELELTFEIPHEVAQDMTIKEIGDLRADLMKVVREHGREYLKIRGHEL